MLELFGYSRRGGLEPKGAAWTSEPVPSGIVGRWAAAGSPIQHEFVDAGDHAVHYLIGSCAYGFSAGGDVFLYCNTDYIRVLGTGTNLVGVWEKVWSASLTEEWHFRADQTYSVHWSDGEDYIGTYAAETPVPGKLETRELRSIVTFNGPAITFDPPWMPTNEGTYVLSGDSLTINVAGTTLDLLRV